MSIKIGSNGGMVSRSVKLYDSETVSENHVCMSKHFTSTATEAEKIIQHWMLSIISPILKNNEYIKQS